MRTHRPTSAAVPFILVSLLLDTLGVGLIIPVGPRLVGSFLGQDLGGASRYYGLLFAIYSAMQFAFAPIVGGLSDRFGRRTVLLPSQLGAAASYLIGAMAPALPWLFVARIISGITGASFSAATAYIADVTPPEKRAQSFGLVGAAFGLGFVVGPVMGGLLGGISLRLPYFVAAGLTFLNFVYGVVILPESLRREDQRPFSLRRANPLGSLRNLGRHPIVFGLTGAMTCGSLAQMVAQSVWALSNQGRFGWQPGEIGLSLGLMGVAMAVVQGGLIRAVMPRFGERRVLLGGTATSAIAFVGFGLASHSWMVYALVPLLALGGLAGPATQSLISREVGPSEQGEIQGSLASLSSLAAIAGPLLGTSLFAHFGPDDAHPHVPGAPYFAAGLCNILGLALAARLFARMSPPRAPSRTAPPTANGR